MSAYRTPARWAVAAMVLPLALALPASAQQPMPAAGAARYATGSAQPVDGRIVFWSDDCQIYCPELYLMHADGSHQHLVTGDLLAENPDWGTAPLQHGRSAPVPTPTAAETGRFHRVQALDDPRGDQRVSLPR